MTLQMRNQQVAEGENERTGQDKMFPAHNTTQYHQLDTNFVSILLLVSVFFFADCMAAQSYGFSCMESFCF